MFIDVSELNQLAVDLGKVPAKTVAKATAVTRLTAAAIERDGKLFAPVDTGNLRNSISSTVTGLHAEIGPTAEYGRYVEEGTSVMAPHAYMGPSLDRNTPDYVAALEQLAQDAL